MADTLLEQTRALHEDMERMERVIAKDLKREFKVHKEKLLQSHRAKRRVDAIQEAARKLAKIYEDEDGSRKEEIAALANKDNPFTAFYDRLREVRDYHRRFATAELTEMESDEAYLKEELPLTFTGEEGLGRYLDLHAHYTALINAKFGNKELQYYEYIDGLKTHLAAVGRHHKLTPAYKRYVQALLDYLVSFYVRIQPLAQIARQLTRVEEATKATFEAGNLAGWEDKGLSILTPQAAPPPTNGGLLALPAPELGPLDVQAYNSAEELEGAGAERLKEALAALGFKCGGTLKERAQRLWLTRSTPLHLLDKKLFAKGVAAPAPAAAGDDNGAEGAAFDASKRQQMALELAVLEAQVSKMCELLAAVVSDTKGRVEKRQAQTYDELLAEQEEAEQEAMAVAGTTGEGGEVGGGSDGEDEFVYNPLKLPLGWDGKPIPYWLYKLHGLNQEFECEICGGFKYQGRRAYERHFKEWRHQNGMRALGIPNNKNFFEITRIEDAQALWEDIQKKQKGGFKAETEEEYEDSHGNVYNKRTYLDLKRQGLL